MKKRCLTPDFLLPASTVIAALVWLTVIIITGIINHSLYIGVVAATCCALYSVGFIKFLDPHTAFRNNPITKSLIWFLLSALFVYATLIITNFNSWFLWFILVVLQIPPYIFSKMIDKRVAKEIKVERKKEYPELSRSAKVQAAMQSTNMNDYANALGLKVLDLRPQHDRQLEESARFLLEAKDEEYARELVFIFQQAHELFQTDNDAYQKKRNEARMIGQFLCDHGGNDRMTLIAYRVQALGGRASDCESVWQGICGWEP